MTIKNVLVFFFSSRRRHTRWTGDWSSDVCSSDLDSPLPDGTGESAPCGTRARGPGRGGGSLYGAIPPQRALRVAGAQAREPFGRVDYCARSGGALRRPEETRGSYWYRPVPPGALR